jgi:hypothetical protein
MVEWKVSVPGFETFFPFSHSDKQRHPGAQRT